MDDFSQKAKQSFKMGFNFLHKKAQQTVDTAKLSSQLKQAQDSKQQALVALGERVCVMFDMDCFQPEELKDAVQTIRERQALIEKLEADLQDVHKGEQPTSSSAPAEPQVNTEEAEDRPPEPRF